MDPRDLAGLTVYSDLMTVLKDRGFSDAQAGEMFLKLTTQVEMEVVEEIMSDLSEEQLAKLDSLSEDLPAQEIAKELGIDGEEVDSIRAEKLAAVLEETLPTIESNNGVTTQTNGSPEEEQNQNLN